MKTPVWLKHSTSGKSGQEWNQHTGWADRLEPRSPYGSVGFALRGKRRPNQICTLKRLLCPLLWGARRGTRSPSQGSDERDGSLPQGGSSEDTHDGCSLETEAAGLPVECGWTEREEPSTTAWFLHRAAKWVVVSVFSEGKVCASGEVRRVWFWPRTFFFWVEK